jgi:hypothetical protein
MLVRSRYREVAALARCMPAYACDKNVVGSSPLRCLSQKLACYVKPSAERQEFSSPLDLLQQQLQRINSLGHNHKEDQRESGDPNIAAIRTADSGYASPSQNPAGSDSSRSNSESIPADQGPNEAS